MSATRRDFLKSAFGASALVSLSPTVPSFLARAAAAAGPRRHEGDTILVVVQMAGGNDDLNTVIPYADDAYAKNRPTLRFTADQVHKIDDSSGFHPRMEAFSRLYKDGHLSLLQGVGYPNSNRGHFEAMRDWQTARPGDNSCPTGWVGRVVDTVYRPEEAVVPAMFVGQIARPFALNAQKAMVPSVRTADQATLKAVPGTGDAKAHRRQMAELAELDRSGPENPTLDFLRQSTLKACATSKQVEAATEARSAAAEYPSISLAGNFRTIAQLIRADLGIRVFFTEVGGNEPGGFDNHANQLGNHCALLHQLSESVAAFVDDLKRDGLLDRVLVMTFSEFGRTLAENGRRGTDHGAAQCLFLAGGKLRGGLVGKRPSLTELDAGALKVHTDFRRVYATLLDRWLGFDSRSALGEEYEPLDVLQA